MLLLMMRVIVLQYGMKRITSNSLSNRDEVETG